MSCQQRQSAPGKGARKTFESELPRYRASDFREKHDHYGKKDHRHVVSAFEKQREEKGSERRRREEHHMRKLHEQ